jgi:hypothetical protein
VSIGGGIFSIVVGAILAFAVNVQIGGVNLHVIGSILMLAGVIGLIIGIALATRRRRVTSITRSAVDPVTGERISRRSIEDDAPLI